MKKLTIPVFLLFPFLLVAQISNDMMPMLNIHKQSIGLEEPVAEKVPYEMEIHGDTRVDDYYWMRLSDEQKNASTPDEATQKVLDYIGKENQYTSEAMSHLDPLKESLFEEIKARIKQTDLSVPYKYHGYYYITRYNEGQEYPLYTRKRGSLTSDEEIMLDVNELAKDYDFYTVGGRNVSPNNTLLAYGEDTLSRRIYTIRFKNIRTGEMLEDRIENTTGSVVWANDNKTVFYTRKDEALRAYKIFKHKLGTDASEDVEVYHEADETFRTFVYKTKSDKYIVIGSGATLSNEYRIINADTPDAEFTLFHPRERKLEYGIKHYGDQWYILTNKDGATNFKLMKTPESATDAANWVDVIPHREEVLLEGIDIFKDYMVLSERENATTYIQIRPWDGSEPHHIAFTETAYSVYTSVNPEFDTDELRIAYTSLTTPNTTYDYNMQSRTLDLKKQQEVIGDFKPENYHSERVMVKARDGVMVPMSIVYRKDFRKNGTQPVLLYGYGSYGYSIDPYFSSVRLSLLDRGFAFAIAHIRGGQEMGRQWYEDGKYLKKKNTFTDFIDCGKYLVENEYADTGHLYAMGGSAGGLLMGAVMNMAPDMWNGVIAAVPFVDVVTTMLDESIPLTTGEFDEWGNPKDETYYHYMKSYSPYDNVEAKDYPSTLITTGYFDSQVQYWEPLKWIARLRELKTDDNPLLLHCQMGTGHSGSSGRFERLKETALEYAYLLDRAGRASME